MLQERGTSNPEPGTKNRNSEHEHGPWNVELGTPDQRRPSRTVPLSDRRKAASACFSAIVSRSERSSGSVNARPARELLVDALQAPLDLEPHARGGHLETLAPLSLEIAILLERAHPEPAQSANRNQRRGGQEHGNSARVGPCHGDAILRRLVDRRVTVRSRTRHARCDPGSPRRVTFRPAIYAAGFRFSVNVTR